MRRFLLAVLLSFLLAGLVQAQELTGPKAEEVKKEILKLELDKVPHLGDSTAADWWALNNADSITYTDAEGKAPTKAEHVASMRSGVHFWVGGTLKQDGHRVRVYGDGNTAVVTYLEHGDHASNGKVASLEIRATDVWLKQGADWQRVVHTETPVTGQ